MRLQRRVTASWKFVGSDALVADSLLLVNRFFWMQRRKTCGILAHMPCEGDDLAVFDVEDVSHGRDPRPACRLRTPAPRHSTHLGLYLSVNTRQPKALRPRVAGADNCNWTAPGIAVDRTPDVDESKAKENPQQCVCKSGLAPYGSC